MFPPAGSPSRKWFLRSAMALAVIAGGGTALFLARSAVLPLAPAKSSAGLMEAELVRAAARADICSAANAVGVGLRGEYFTQPFLRGKAALVRVDETIDFDASIKRPGSGDVPALGSVRWSGWIKPPMSGSYRFHADAPNMQVLVARNVVAGVDAPPDGKVELAAGRFYPVEVIVNKIADSGAPVKLEWTAPHGARYVVPRALLNVPSETATASRS
ncbi:PA14 domain-containing protein [Hydrogenophaga laconesensis]|uniref:PA14 domain-containing protein n=1 Tax=Hydrogenophaga laconesensis TaxID=1805971 RepID=UPI00286A3C6C|nr:PA14 domain-containing protein [Hydrogenophaga laconesensis]